LKRPCFRNSFNVYLLAFDEVLGDTGAISPIGTIYPGRFLHLVPQAIPVFLRMRHREVDYIFSINGINHAILAEVTDYLHFNHSAQILLT
jgi:hypothetical protein